MRTSSMSWMIDTLKYAKGLEQAGVNREAAEFQADALAQALDGAAQTVLATKSDLRELGQFLETKIQDTDQRLTAEIHALRDEMHLQKQELKDEMHLLNKGLKDEMHLQNKELKDEMHLLKQELKDEMHLQKQGLKDEMHLLKQELKDEMHLQDKGLRDVMHAQDIRLQHEMQGLRADMYMQGERLTLLIHSTMVKTVGMLGGLMTVFAGVAAFFHFH